MHRPRPAFSSLVVLAFVIGGAPAWADGLRAPHPTVQGETQVSDLVLHKKHKHRSRNFYGKHYDPWAHSKGSH